MYVEDFDGRVGVMTQIEDLDAVAAALDRRGVRELALSTAIDKAYKYSPPPLWSYISGLLHLWKLHDCASALLLNTTLFI